MRNKIPGDSPSPRAEEILSVFASFRHSFSCVWLTCFSASQSYRLLHTIPRVTVAEWIQLAEEKCNQRTTQKNISLGRTCYYGLTRGKKPTERHWELTRRYWQTAGSWVEEDTCGHKQSRIGWRPSDSSLFAPCMNPESKPLWTSICCYSCFLFDLGLRIPLALYHVRLHRMVALMSVLLERSCSFHLSLVLVFVRCKFSPSSLLCYLMLKEILTPTSTTTHSFHTKTTGALSTVSWHWPSRIQSSAEIEEQLSR